MSRHALVLPGRQEQETKTKTKTKDDREEIMGKGSLPHCLRGDLLSTAAVAFSCLATHTQCAALCPSPYPLPHTLPLLALLGVSASVFASLCLHVFVSSQQLLQIQLAATKN